LVNTHDAVRLMRGTKLIFKYHCFKYESFNLLNPTGYVMHQPV